MRGRTGCAAVTEAQVLEGTIELRVRYAETDQMGVVYHANYLVWCEMGRTDLMRSLGASYAEMELRGVYLTVFDVRIRFRTSVRYDDVVRVRTTLTRVRSRGVSFSYEMESQETGASLASATTDLICIDGDGATRVLPDEIRALLAEGAATAGQ